MDGARQKLDPEPIVEPPDSGLENEGFDIHTESPHDLWHYRGRAISRHGGDMLRYRGFQLLHSTSAGTVFHDNRGGVVQMFSWNLHQGILLALAK